MIIECINCNKKFEVDPKLIPEKGRSIQCGSCDHKWFYKKDTQETILEINNETPVENTNQEIKIDNDITEDKVDTKKITEEIAKDKIESKKNDVTKTLKKSNILNKIISYLIVAIISFVALIIVLDTFKTPLNNFFETLKDLYLFIKNLFI